MAYVTSSCIVSLKTDILNNFNKLCYFLKAAIMRSHNYAKYLRLCANLGLKNANQEKNGTNGVFLPQFDNVI